MEPEDLPWPGELEEEEPEAEEEEVEGGEEYGEAEAEDEVVMVQEVEDEKGPDSDCDYPCVPLECNYECQARECTDEEEDDAEGRAWLQASPNLPSPHVPQPRPSRGKPCPPQKMTHHIWQQSVSQDKSGKQVSDTHVFPLGKIQQSSREEKVDHSIVDSNQSFSSILPPFVPPESTTKSDYHSVDLRMLRISSDTMPDTHPYLAGSTSRGGIAKIIQSNLKPGITSTTSGDSDFESLLSLSPEDIPQLSVRSPQEYITGQYSDSLNQRIFSHLAEETLRISAVPELAEQRTEKATVPLHSYSHRDKQIFPPREVPDSHLPKETLKTADPFEPADQKTGLTVRSSYLHGENSYVAYQPTLSHTHLTEQVQGVSSIPGFSKQTTGILKIPSSSILQREKSTFYQQELQGGHFTEQSQNIPIVPGLASQKTGILKSAPPPYSQSGKTQHFLTQESSEQHLTEEDLKVSFVTGLAGQEPRKAVTPSASYSKRGKLRVIFEQEIPDSHLSEEGLKDSSVPDQKTGRPTTPSTSSLQKGKPSLAFQQELPDSRLTEEALRVSSVLGLLGQETGRPTTSSTSSLQSGESSLAFQQEIPDSHLTEEALRVSSVLGLLDQETGRPIAPSTYSEREKPRLVYQQEIQGTGRPVTPSTYSERGKHSLVFQQEIPDSRLTEEALRVSSVLGLSSQETGRPTTSSTSSLQRGKLSLVYQQEIPDSHLTEEALRVSSILELVGQETGQPIAPSTYSEKGKPRLVYQQEISGSHLTEENLKDSSVLDLARQRTGRPITPSSSYLQKGKPSLVYQQEIPVSHLTEAALKVSPVLGLAGQDTRRPITPTTSSFQRGKPSLVYQEEIPDSHLTEEVLKVWSSIGLTDQETGRPIASSTSPLQRGRPSLVFQQEIADRHLTEEVPKISSALGLPGQDPRRPITYSTSSLQRGKPSLVYQQEIPDSHLTEEAFKVWSVLTLTDQDTSSPVASSTSSFQREKPSLVYQQEIPDSHLTEATLKVSPVLGLAGQDTRRPITPSTSSFQRRKSSLVYQQEIPDSYLTEEALRVFSVHVLKDQETGRPVAPSTSSLQRGKQSIVYQQEIPVGHLTEETLRVSSLGLEDQETRIQTAPSSSYSQRDHKPTIFYHQEFPGSPLVEGGLRVSTSDQSPGLPIGSSRSKLLEGSPHPLYQQAFPPDRVLEFSGASGSAEKKSRLPPEVSSLYSPREKPGVFYQQDLLVDHLTEQAKKISPAPRPTDQRTGISIVTAPHSHREKPFVLYPQDLPDVNLVEDTLKGLPVSGKAEQKTGILTDSTSLRREKSFISSPPGLPGSYLPAETKVLTVLGPVDQKTGLPSEPSNIYPHREKSIIFYQQDLEDSHAPEETLKNFTALGPSDQKTSLPLKSSSYSQREKPIISYQQVSPGNYLTEPSQKVSPVSGLVDQKSRISPVSSFSLSREKPIISYQQELPGRPQANEIPKVSGVLRLTDQKIEKPNVPSSSYSHIEKPISSYQPKPPDLIEETFQTVGVSVSSDQEGGVSREPFPSYSQRENPVVYHKQVLVYTPPNKESEKVSAADPADRKPGTLRAPSPFPLQQEKPIVFHQQGLPDRHLNEEVPELSTTDIADQKSETSTVSSPSYSESEKSIVFHHSDSADRQFIEEIRKVSAATRISEQPKTRIPVEISPYSRGEKPISYQQELLGSQQSEESLNVPGIPGPVDQKIGKPTLPSSLYSHIEKPISSYQQLFPNLTAKALKILDPSRRDDQESRIPVTPTSYLPNKKPIVSYQQELPEPNQDTLKPFKLPGPTDQKTGKHIAASTSKPLKGVPDLSYSELPDSTDNNLKVSAIPGLADQKTGKQTIPSSSYSYRKKTGHFYPQELPDVTDQSLKGYHPGPADQKTELPTEAPSSYLHKDKVKISALFLPDNQNTEFQTTPSHSRREAPKNLTVIESDDQKSSSEVFPKSHRVKTCTLFQQQLPDKQTGDTPKILTVPGTTEVNSEMHREISDTSFLQKLADKHLIEDTLKFSGDTGQTHVSGLLAVPPGIYSHSEKHSLVSDHVQKLIDNLDSSNSSISSNIPLSSQTDDRVVLSKPECSDFDGVGSDEIQDLNGDSRTLKEIRTLLMEAENIALKRCHFPSPLVPFRDVSDISVIQAKKVVCFKEPASADEYDDDLPQRQLFREESPSSKSIQKDISTQTNQKCQRGIENWEFFSSATVRSPRQEAESKARMTLDETLRRYNSARSVKPSEPDICRRNIGGQIVIPMVTVLKNDSSSDASSCSWDSNSLESVSDVFLNFFPCASPKTSMTDSREEEGVSESDDGGDSSVDSLAARVKNLLKCESSLNHAKQILRNAEKEECRVRARAWNLKFNLAREYECGYSISELNEDDRKKVEEIKEKFFVHGRTTNSSKCLQSPREVGCQPEAVCSHIIIESHEKGCFSTLTAEQPQLDTDPCAVRFAEPLEVIRRPQSPPSWRARQINFCRSLEQSNSNFNVWNSLQFQSHSPFQTLSADDFKIRKGVQMSFHENMNPWLLELEEPECVLPEEIDCHSSQMLIPEPMKQFTTSITFASHQHSNCFSDSSVLNVDVTEGCQCPGTSWGVLSSHFTEEQSPRDLKQKATPPSLFKVIDHSLDKAVAVLEDSGGQNKKLHAEHFYQEEKFNEKPDFKCSHSEPHTHAHSSKNKEVHFSDDHTLIRMDSSLAAKEKTVTVSPDLPSHIFLEQRELFEKYTPSRADSVRKKHSRPPQHQDSVAPNLTSHASLEKEEKNRVPHKDHKMGDQSPFMQGQVCKTSSTPHSIFLEQRELFEKSKVPNVDCRMRKDHPPLPQGQEDRIEKNNQHKSKSQVSNVINVEACSSNAVPQSKSSQFTLVTSAPTPPSNKKALSCVRITLGPKTSSKLDGGTLDKRFPSLDSASKRMVSSRSLEPTSKVLISKPKAQEQETAGFIKPPSDLKVAPSHPDDNTVAQDLNTKPLQNSQTLASKQTQVSISDLERYHNTDETPLPESADRTLELILSTSATFYSRKVNHCFLAHLGDLAGIAPRA